MPGLLCPALNADSIRQHTDLPFHTWRDEDGPDAALADLLAQCGANRFGVRVALDETMRTDFSLRLLDALPGCSHSFTDATVGYLRASKDDAEYAAAESQRPVE